MIFLGCTITGTYIILANFLGWTDALKKLSNIFYLLKKKNNKTLISFIEKCFEKYIYNLFI